MQTHTEIHPQIPTETANGAGYRRRGFRGLVQRALAALVEGDRRYREAGKLRRMDDERLADMGITRAEADNGCRGARRQG